MSRPVLIEVFVKDINKALQLFKRRTKELGIIEELNSRKYYENPSSKRHKDKSNKRRQNRAVR